jgi:hypothetical protein
MMGSDPVKYAVWGLWIGLALSIACALYVAWANGASRNIALGIGALLVAVVAFVIQVNFELQGSKSAEDFYLEVIVDFQTYKLRSVQPNNSYSNNSFIESEASKILAGVTPSPGTDDAPHIARDLGVLSILTFLFNEQPDWQLDSSTYQTSRGQMQTWAGLSKPDECSPVSIEMVQEKLSKAGNMFATAFATQFPPKLCLPPGSILDVIANGVTITNRICQLTIVFREPFVSMQYLNPQNPVSDPPVLQNGKPRFRSVVIGGRVTTEFSRWRAQAAESSKYQAWTKRIPEGLKRRFGNA